MFKKNLADWLHIAQNSDFALPHFNVSTPDQLKTIIEVCASLQSPVIIGVSEGEADFIGYDFVVYLIRYYREKTKLPIFLNADHHHSLERAKIAIDTGFDSVNIDCSQKRDFENISETRAVVEFAKKINKNINIEGEIGALPTQSSEILKKDIKIDPKTFTNPQEAKIFVDKTGVDRLAPAVGTLHGIKRSGINPKLHFEIIEALYKTIDIPMTLHGGSGTPLKDLERAREYFSNIHINTDLRVAYTNGIKKEIEKTTTPYKYLEKGSESMKKVVEKYIRLFNSLEKV